jgi:hypothetical protein
MENPCPSDLLLDRYLAGELEAGEREVLERHLAGCEACGERVQERRAELEGYKARPELPSDAAAVLRRWAAAGAQKAAEGEGLGVEGRPRRSAAPIMKRLWVWGPSLAAAAAAAVLVVILLPRQAAPPGEGDGLRIKGSFAIGAFLRRDGAVSRARSGQVFHPGDQLRFSYASRRDGYLCLVGLDAKKVVTVYHPWDAASAPRVVQGNRALPDSTVLDETLGRETVVGVLCPKPFAVAGLKKAAPRLIADLREGKPVSDHLPDPKCRVARFELEKRAR